MRQKHDVVETSKMHLEDVRAVIDSESIGKTDMDNGRLVQISERGVYEYTKDGTAERLFLVCTPEAVYDGEGLDSFYNVQGRKIRVAEIILGNRFATTAVEEGLAVGDKLSAGADGKLAKGEDGAIVFEVVRLATIAGNRGVTVERIK